jgi:hypothetical protein
VLSVKNPEELDNAMALFEALQLNMIRNGLKADYLYHSQRTRDHDTRAATTHMTVRIDSVCLD